MKIQEAVETCVTKKYADFHGDATRSEYWYFVLFYFVIEALLHFVSHGIAAIFALAMLVPLLSAAVRRLHDTSRSGWWLLLSLIPVLGTIALVVLLVQPGRSPTTPT
jgi:uncharacterized membrane protein YhaH (DUF805 family)